MRSTLFSDGSVSNLIHNLKVQIKTFIHEEIQLASAEMATKAKSAALSSATILGALVVAGAGMFLVLIAIGFLIAFAYEQFGWNPLLAICAGLGSIGIVVAIVSGVVAMVGIRKLMSQSLKPEKTLETLKQLRPSSGESESAGTSSFINESEKRSPDELKDEVEETEGEIHETLHELRYRASAEHLKLKAAEELHAHPYRWGLLAIGTGILGGAALKRKFNHTGS